MKNLKSKVLQKAQTQASDGEAIYIIDSDSLVVHATGTSTNFNIDFLASMDGVNYFKVMGTKSSDYSATASNITTLGDGWEFNVGGYLYFKAKITSIADGNITVIANAYNE